MNQSRLAPAEPLPRRSARGKTRARILAAAEALFADHGYDGTSTHEIARACAIEQSLVNYHFGSKEQLYREVIGHRAEAFRDLRSAALDAALAPLNGAPAAVEALLAAFVHPVLDQLTGDDRPFRDFIRLLGQGAHLTRRPDLHAQWDGLYQPVLDRFVAEMQRSLPDCPRDDILWALHFAHAALGSLIGPGNALDGKKLAPQGADLARLKQKFVALFAAGLRNITA